MNSGDHKGNVKQFTHFGFRLIFSYMNSGDHKGNIKQFTRFGFRLIFSERETE
jgi:hypothetical protein